MLVAMERDRSLPGIKTKVLHTEALLRLNGFSLNGRVRAMFDGSDYCAVDIVISFLCGFIDRVTGLTKRPKFNIVHAIYSSLISRVVSGNCKRRWTVE